MSFSVLVLNGAYAALLLSTFTRTVVWLRVTLVAAALIFVLYGILEDIPSMVVWNLVIGGLHLSKILADYRTQRSVHLTAAESAARDELFPDASDFDFNLLWRLGSSTEYVDTPIISAGVCPDFVALVVAGIAIVERDGHEPLGIQRGGLLGEMSFVSGQPATATVRAVQPVQVHQWEQQQLATLKQVHPRSARLFEDLMQRGLVEKARKS